MRLFWEIAKLSFRRQINYRAAALAGVATNFFFGLLRAAVLLAFMGARNEAFGFDRQQVVTFTGLTQAVIAYLSFFNWTELIDTVYTGQVAGQLLKPMSFFYQWLARDAGRALAQALMRGLTLLGIYSLLFDLTFPSSWQQWLVVLIALSLAWLVSFSWRFLVSLTAFWSPNATGYLRFFFGLSWILSGFAFPLRFFPDWFQDLAYMTPFPALVNTPIELFLGQLPSSQWLPTLAYQIVWAGMLLLAGQLVLRAGIRRLVIQGG
ncbi:MAG: ABC-2 family transporter protein [Anaerolineales bacterium]|jgi:ABC-2 type transport system permease protein